MLVEIKAKDIYSPIFQTFQVTIRVRKYSKILFVPPAKTCGLGTRNELPIICRLLS
jgi:hypothetical protein